MSKINITIKTITPSDIPQAVTCIQNAFADDPYRNWIFPNSSAYNAKRNTSSLTARCHWGIRHALFHVARDADTGKFLGIAMWLPPNLATSKAPSRMSWTDWFTFQSAEWSLWFAQLGTNLWHMGRGGLNVKRYWIWKEAQANAQSELWTDEDGYYFCNIVTVVPEAQGKGVGRALVEEVTSMADEEGRRCYLESSRDVPNVQIYSKMGFELVRELSCTDGNDDGIKLYCMTREPRKLLKH